MDAALLIYIPSEYCLASHWPTFWTGIFFDIEEKRKEGRPTKDKERRKDSGNKVFWGKKSGKKKVLTDLANQLMRHSKPESWEAAGACKCAENKENWLQQLDS